MNARAVALIGAAWLGASGVAHAQDTLRIAHEQIPGFLAPGVAGVVVADFDRDGRDDVAMAGHQNEYRDMMGDEVPESGFVAIFHDDAASGMYAITQTLVGDLARLTGLASDGSAEPGLVAVSYDGVLAHYAGRPLALVSEVALGRPVATMRVGDVDGDGRIEVVVSDATQGMAAYDLATGALKRTYEGRAPTSIALAALDADPALEIIAAGVPGVIVDGATNASDWQDAGGFGEILAPGHFFADRSEGFIAANTWFYFSAYRGAPYSPIWSLKSTTISVDAADLDGDGIDEILYAGDYGAGFAVLDALTQDIRFRSGHSTMGHVGAARLPSANTWQFAFGERLGPNGGDTVQIVTDAGELAYALHEEVGGFAVSADTDLDGDGRDDAAWISTISNAGYDGGRIHVYDPATGAEQWQHRLSVDGGIETTYRSLTAVAVAPLRDGAPAELVVGETGIFYDAALDVIDGVTHDIARSNTQTGFDGAITHIVPVPAAGGSDLFVAASGDPIALGRFDGRDLHALWRDALDASLGEALDDVQPLATAGASAYLLAAPHGLVAYDIDARRVLWSKDLAAASSTVLHLADGTAVIGVLTDAARLVLLDASGAATLADFAVGTAEPGAVRAWPDQPGKAIVCADRRVVVVDLDARTVVAASPWIGALACGRGHLAVGAAEGGRVRVRAGSLVGVFDLVIAADALFADGFDRAR